MEDPRRLIPRTDALLADPRFAVARERLGHDRVKAVVTAAQRRARAGEIAPQEVAQTALAALPRGTTGLRPVLNATGVILHTNLGRAPLSAAAREALQLAAGATDVELDLATGARGRRGRLALAALAGAVPVAESVHVVNNNAAALVLAATALAAGREIVISRGELIEIGDGFRLPELLVSTGARLREVGTTNRTTPDDYRRVIGPETGFVLKVHPSNYRIEGFTSGASVAALAALCMERKVPLVGDIGSGLLRPEPMLPDEPDAASWLGLGADLVTASGDKLLGGPQCGLLLGRADLVERLRRHPLARALRVDKLTMAALEATLNDTDTPVSRALGVGAAQLRQRAEHIAGRLREAGVGAGVVTSEAVVGGGGAPEVTLPSVAVALEAGLSVALRHGTPPVLGRVTDGRCLLDLRTLPAEDDETLIDAVRGAAACG
ncbi:L-seryl-tRNA(Sec) selenium transferase [Actinomadura alba]|uniref:L-seryl-tRNA(Sec) selenium transferase n=1 Tax=Actinomadura alba TaxID=406431 RepID=A0ABR7LGQ5_9ACTN|nr:L-seryl-tRNA(Sec) selenium transferase [Actinomadura alba]MBC6463961.1 L-seryl-tRNA(Sec) selenium transferase [Actinomadura alba]